MTIVFPCQGLSSHMQKITIAHLCIKTAGKLTSKTEHYALANGIDTVSPVFLR